MLAGTEPTDTLYPQILYTRALVAADPPDMRTDLQRVATEYASSNWADDALLRLALIEYAGGQLDASARHLERIDLDHSSSPLYPRAAYWAGRVYFELRRPEDACRWLRQGGERAGRDVELRNQLESYTRRCADVADTRRVPAGGQPAGDTVLASRSDTAVAADSSRAGVPAPPPAEPLPPPAPVPSPSDSLAASPVPAAPPAPEPARPPASAGFRIQIAAVNTAGAADTIAGRARAAGIDAVVVHEAPYYKVRVGSYATRAEAAAALPAVRARFRGAPFVVTSRE
jgi:cell division septation protein DedD